MKTAIYFLGVYLIAAGIVKLILVAISAWKNHGSK